MSEVQERSASSAEPWSLAKSGTRAFIRTGWRTVLLIGIPLIVALPAAFWVVNGTYGSTLTPLGRDQGIFQYIAWAVAQGDVDYRDIRDVNGPLTHLVHFVFLKLGGADEHRFHVLDTFANTVAFLAAGFCLPGIAIKSPKLVERFAWAIAAWVILMAQYLAYVYWDIAQRESFFVWFVVVSLGTQLVAQKGSPYRNWMLGAAGALSVIPWFGKPTFVAITMAQVVTLLVDGNAPRKEKLRPFVVGGALGAATQVGYLLVYGDLRAYVSISLHDVPAMYRFIWPRAAYDIFAGAWYSRQAIYALAGAAVMIVMIIQRLLPVRVLAIALAPLCAVWSCVVQGKGFPYHFHAVTATIHLQWLLLVVWLSERLRYAPRTKDEVGVRLLPAMAAAALALWVATDVAESPHVKNVWLATHGRTAEQRSTREYFASFPEADFFPWDLRQAATFLREHTGEQDRVQVYGMDPYLLFLAKRRSATPYIYSYDLNVDAALAGGTAAQPTEVQAAKIRAIRSEHEEDMVRRLRERPAAAFVFIDKSPLISAEDAWQDFQSQSPKAAAFVREQYEDVVRIGVCHIFLRRSSAL